MITMGKLVRYISTDGQVSVIAVDTTDLVARAEQFHSTSAVVTAALGRLLTAASMIGSSLKGENDSVTLRLKGNGPAGAVIAVSDSSGCARGYAANPVVELPLNQLGKLDVAGAVGQEGTLYVIKDMGLKEPYSGQTPIVSGEIAEDITHYFAISEQTPTVCALGVLVNPDLTVKAAGGFLVQLLPFAEEEVIDKIEAALSEIPSVTAMLEQGMTPDDIAHRALKGISLDLLDTSEVGYRCNCSRARVGTALLSTGREALEEMAADTKNTEVCCHFCDKKYVFTPADIDALRTEGENV